MPAQNNRQNYSEAINSRGIQFFNKDGFEGSTLVVSLWNQNLVMKIHPAKEKTQQTDTSIYDYDHAVTVVLTPVVATTIANVCKERLMPALMEGKEFTICVPCGTNSGVVLSTGVKRFGKLVPYTAILKSIQAGTLTPEEAMCYEFNKSRIIENYDGTTAEGVTQRFEYSELVYFIYALERISMALIGAENHASRYNERFFNKQLFGLYKGLSEKMGVPFYQQRQSNNYHRNSGGNVFANTDSYSPGSYGNSAPAQEPLSGEPVAVDSLADLDSFL